LGWKEDVEMSKPTKQFHTSTRYWSRERGAAPRQPRLGRGACYPFGPSPAAPAFPEQPGGLDPPRAGGCRPSAPTPHQKLFFSNSLRAGVGNLLETASSPRQRPSTGHNAQHPGEDAEADCKEATRRHRPPASWLPRCKEAAQGPGPRREAR